jgi:hypothetical protein
MAKQTTGVNPMAQATPPPPEPRGLRKREKAEKEEATYAAMSSQERAQFTKAFGACLKAKGYFVG